MEFEARRLHPYAEPISANELQEEQIYFTVHFLDDEQLVPIVETLVFLGRDLEPDDKDLLYFQDAQSYKLGVRIDEDRHKKVGHYVRFYRQPENQINHIFTYEKALDQLMACSLRRRNLDRG